MSNSLRPHGPPLSMGILQARILQWVSMPLSRGSSQPRDRTQVSHIASGFFTSWAMREAPKIYLYIYIYIFWSSMQLYLYIYSIYVWIYFNIYLLTRNWSRNWKSLDLSEKWVCPIFKANPSYSPMATPREGHSFHLFPFPHPPHWSSYFLEKTEATRRAHLYLPPTCIFASIFCLAFCYQEHVVFPVFKAKPFSRLYTLSLKEMALLVPVSSIFPPLLPHPHQHTNVQSVLFNLLIPHVLPDTCPLFCPSSGLPSGLRYSLLSLSPLLSFSTEILQSGCCSQDTETRGFQIVNIKHT